MADGSRPIRYAALGDSYTIGTGVHADERWPDQLIARLRGTGVQIELVANLGVNGFTSADIVAVELPELERLDPTFATLLVGVNDVIQGVGPERYAANIERILAALLERLPPDRIVTVSTPDYTVTPAGADYGDPAVRAAGIRRFNEILAAASDAHRIAHVDVHDLSLRAATDRTLVADDGLHPSGRQYALWADRIAPVVDRLLGGPRSTS